MLATRSKQWKYASEQAWEVAGAELRTHTLLEGDRADIEDVGIDLDGDKGPTVLTERQPRSNTIIQI